MVLKLSETRSLLVRPRGRGADVRQASDHAATEAILAGSGVPFTSLRHGFYAESALHLLERGIEAGEIRAPEDGPVSWTTRADLAEADAIVLSGDRRREGRVRPRADVARVEHASGFSRVGRLDRRAMHPTRGLAELVDGNHQHLTRPRERRRQPVRRGEVTRANVDTSTCERCRLGGVSKAGDDLVGRPGGGAIPQSRLVRAVRPLRSRRS